MKQEYMSPARRYERLSRLRNYSVDRHQVDPRGWDVVNREGRKLGDVKDLIVDTERMAGAYLDIELDRKLFELREDPHVIVPMGRAHRDGSHRRVIVEGLTRDRVAQLYAARWAHQFEFWDSWWEADVRPSRPATARDADDHLRRALETVGPGETVRIPVVNEEIVVERRQVPEEPAIARDK